MITFSLTRNRNKSIGKRQKIKISKNTTMDLKLIPVFDEEQK